MPSKIFLLLPLLLASVVAQDEAVCTELRDSIDNVITLDIKDSCDCSGVEDGTRLACEKSSACISSNGGDPMVGDFSETFTKTGTSSSSFAQQTEITTCFDYPDDLYNGTKVCLTKFEDGLGTNNACEVTVDGSPCTVCRFCGINQVTFDCSNLGYQDKLACRPDNADDSLLQFLFEPAVAEGCDTSGGSNNGGANGGGNDGSSVAFAKTWSSLLIVPFLLLL